MSHYKNGSILRELFSDSAIRTKLHSLMDKLSEREQYVVKMRLGLGADDGKNMTLESIGKELKCTRERVRQIQNEAFDKLVNLGLEIK